MFQEEEVIVWNGLNKSTARIEKGILLLFAIIMEKMHRTVKRITSNADVADVPRGPPQPLRVESTPEARSAIERHKETTGVSTEGAELSIGARCRNPACNAVHFVFSLYILLRLLSCYGHSFFLDLHRP